MFAWIVAGCPTRTQSWWLVVPEAAYSVWTGITGHCLGTSLNSNCLEL